MYYWHIIHQSENELIRKVYDVQGAVYTKGDWFQMMKNEKEKYDILSTDEEVSKMTKYRFKKLVEKKVNAYAFKYLKEKAQSHSKSLRILEEVERNPKMRRPTYLRGNLLLKSDCQLLFELRSKMLDVKTNFSNLYDNDTSCRTCTQVGAVEDEDHLLHCDALRSENMDQEVKFDFVFEDVEKQIRALKVFKAVIRKRNFLLK